MRITVHDANIFIDLVETGLLDVWLEIGLDARTTDLVCHEIISPAQRPQLDKCIKNGLLKVETLEPEALLEASGCAARHGISIADASTLVVAEQLDAILLSGDQRLRFAAKSTGREVHGVIWIFEQLIASAHLRPSEAADKMESLLHMGSFLPLAVCTEAIKKWRGMK